MCGGVRRKVFKSGVTRYATETQVPHGSHISFGPRRSPDRFAALSVLTR